MLVGFTENEMEMSDSALNAAAMASTITNATAIPSSAPTAAATTS